MPDHRYYRASRAADAMFGEYGGIPGWASHNEVDLDALVHLGTQRALRGVMTQFMGYDPAALNLPLNDLRLVDVPENLRSLIPVLAAMFIDGWAAHMHIQPETGD